jgi:hypothetical protein
VAFPSRPLPFITEAKDGRVRPPPQPHKPLPIPRQPRGKWVVPVVRRRRFLPVRNRSGRGRRRQAPPPTNLPSSTTGTPSAPPGPRKSPPGESGLQVRQLRPRHQEVGVFSATDQLYLSLTPPPPATRPALLLSLALTFYSIAGGASPPAPPAPPAPPMNQYLALPRIARDSYSIMGRIR